MVTSKLLSYVIRSHARETCGSAGFCATKSFAEKPLFVLLTSGGVHSQRLSVFLQNENCRYAIVATRPVPPRRGASQTLLQHWKAVFLSRLKSNQYIRAVAHRQIPVFAKGHLQGGFLNSAKLIRTLQLLKPDYILLMNVGIVKREVIETARMGVLNAHPGLLPWVRGVDAVASSLLEGIAAGATVHFVNEGIDTGPILSRHLLPMEADESLEDLKNRANDLALSAMMDIVHRIQNGDDVKCASQLERFALHRRLTSHELAQASTAARNGGGGSLYLSWKKDHPDLCDGAFVLQKYRRLLGRLEIPEQKQSSRAARLRPGYS